MKRTLKMLLLLWFGTMIKANENPTIPLTTSENITTTEENWDFEGRPELGLAGDITYDDNGDIYPTVTTGGLRLAYGLQELKGDFELSWNDKSGYFMIGVTKYPYKTIEEAKSTGPYFAWPIVDYAFFNRIADNFISVMEVDETYTQSNKWDAKNVGPSNKTDTDSFMIKRTKGVISYYVNGQKVHASSRPTTDPLYIQLENTHGGRKIMDLTLKYENTEEDNTVIVNDYLTAEETLSLFEPHSTKSFLEVEGDATRLYGNAPYASTKNIKLFDKNEDVFIEYTAKMTTQKVGLVKFPTYDYKGFYNDEGTVSLRTQTGDTIQDLTTYTEGTIFRIEKIGDVIKYYQNGVEIYEESYNLGDSYYLGLSAPISEGEIAGVKVGTPKIKGNEICSDDGETCVKVANLLYSYDSERQSFEDTASNMINEEGVKYDGVIEREIIVNSLNNGVYFYHVGTNGDQSFFSDSTKSYDIVALEDEVLSFAILINNTTDEIKEYTLNSTLPSEDINILYRREANILEAGGCTLGTNTSCTGTLRVTGDPLPFLHEVNQYGRTSEPTIKLYPNEIAKVVIEFTASVDQITNQYSVNVTDTSTNTTVQTPVNIQVINKPIPTTSMNPILFCDTNASYNATVPGESDSFIELFQEKYGYGLKQLLGTTQPYANHVFDADGTIKTYNNNWGVNNNESMYIAQNVPIRNGREIPMLLFWQLKSSQTSQTIFKTENGQLEYLSDAWINAYINNLNYIHNQIWSININGSVYQYPKENIHLYLADEIDRKGFTQFQLDQIDKLFDRVQSEGYKILITFGNKTTIPLIEKLVDHIDEVFLAFEIDSSIANRLQELQEIHGFNYSRYYISAGRNDRRKWGAKYCNMKSLLTGTEGCSVYQWAGTTNADWYISPQLGYGMNYFNANPAHGMSKHWNPLYKNGGWAYQRHRFTQTSRFLAYSESLTDGKIIKYLKSLNNATINAKLEEYNTDLPSNALGAMYLDIHRLHEISNELRLLYDEYYQGPISSRVATVKEEEKTEIPTFEEPVSFTTVYPNPTSGVVNVKTEKDVKTWKLVSMSGKMIAHGQFNMPKRTFTTNIGNQASGLYILQIIYTDGTAESKKVMKQ